VHNLSDCARWPEPELPGAQLQAGAGMSWGCPSKEEVAVLEGRRCGLPRAQSTKESASVSADLRAMALSPRLTVAPTSSCTSPSESVAGLVDRAGAAILWPYVGGGLVCDGCVSGVCHSAFDRCYDCPCVAAVRLHKAGWGGW
jgi:hypothetical protein